MYGKLSLRASNISNNIFNGKYELQSLMEAVQIGKIFSIDGFSNIPVTKLYSAEYMDCLWIRIDESNATFEELCKDKTFYKDAIVTQVVHLEYRNDHDNIMITHLDHEFVFYDKSEYEKRINKADVKGEKYPRLKSFKIDNAHIPIDFPCTRTIVIENNFGNGTIQKTETVPFLIFILKCYFNHTDLIDEYFTNLKTNFADNN